MHILRNYGMCYVNIIENITSGMRSLMGVTDIVHIKWIWKKEFEMSEESIAGGWWEFLPEFS